MATLNPAVAQWIVQLADAGEAVAFNAYQCLQEEVFKAPAELRGALADALGKELIAEARTAEGGPASFRGNVFLQAAATERPAPKHPARVRTKLARLLGFVSHAAAVPYLAKALGDFEAREMARQALESNGSPQAVEALIAALDSAGPQFRAGVVNSLGKLRGDKAAAAVRKAAADPQDGIRVAALYALAEFPDPTHDAIIASPARVGGERKAAHIARVRLAATLRANGNRAEAERVYRAVLSSDAPEAQKRACRLALG